MIDYKSLPRYPAQCHRPAHDLRQRITDVVAIAVVLGLTFGVIHRCTRAAPDDAVDVVSTGSTTAESNPVPPCPPSDRHREIMELTYAHRGVIVERQCIVIARPSAGPLL